MASNQTITVDVDASGEVTVAVNGVKGSGCSAFTKAIESAIGTTVKDERTPEFLQRAPQATPQHARAGQ